MRQGLLACVVTSLALLLAACGEKSEKKAPDKAVKTETGGKVKTKVSEGKVEVKGKEGEMTITAGGGAEIPEGFPKDVPLYQGAAVVVSSKLGKAFTLVLQTDDDLKTTARTYRAALKAQGWEEENAINLPTGVVVKCTKGERSVTATIAPTKEKTQISLAVEAGE